MQKLKLKEGRLPKFNMFIWYMNFHSYMVKDITFIWKHFGDEEAWRWFGWGWGPHGRREEGEVPFAWAEIHYTGRLTLLEVTLYYICITVFLLVSFGNELVRVLGRRAFSPVSWMLLDSCGNQPKRHMSLTDQNPEEQV